MAFPPQFLDELRNRLTMSEVAGRNLKIARSGHEFKACCPFHQEKTPSFYINDDKGFFHCFGCGAHGDIIGYVMRHDNLSFTEAVSQLAGQAGLTVPALRPEDIVKAKQEKDYFSLMEVATQHYEAALQKRENASVLAYVVERGMTAATIGQFRLGYAPVDDKALTAHLREQGYTEAQMIDAGLIRRSTRDKNNVYGFFRDRLMFPITDRRGRVLAFSGRILPDAIQRLPKRADGETGPKYINSSENTNFQKRMNLYGQAQARANVAADVPPVVVEGQVDVIACHQAGLNTAVAPLGTALTEEQIAALWKMCPSEDKRAIVCFDGDNAGKKAAARALERVLPLLKPRHTLEFVFLPTGEDPDSLLRGGGLGALQTLLHAPMALTDFLWQMVTAGRDLSNAEHRAGVEAAWGDAIAQVKDETLQFHLKRAVKDKLYARPKNDAAYAPRPFGVRPFGVRQAPAQAGIAPQRPHPPNVAEKRAVQVLLLVILRHPWLLREVEAELEGLSVTDDTLDALRHAMLDWFGTVIDIADMTPQAIADYLTAQGLQGSMQDLHHDALALHARFARDGQAEEKIREGWRDIYQSLHSLAMMSDLRQAKAQFDADFTAAPENRLFAVKRMMMAGRDSDDE
ncbi:MAG: DNA primase [Pseudomonadota bacterium]